MDTEEVRKHESKTSEDSEENDQENRNETGAVNVIDQCAIDFEASCKECKCTDTMCQFSKIQKRVKTRNQNSLTRAHAYLGQVVHSRIIERIPTQTEHSERFIDTHRLDKRCQLPNLVARQVQLLQLTAAAKSTKERRKTNVGESDKCSENRGGSITETLSCAKAVQRNQHGKSNK